MKASIKDKLLLFLGGIFLFILLVLLLYDITRRGIFSSKMSLNIVVVGEGEVNVLLLKPEEEMVEWIKLPSNIKVKIFNSDARYPITSLWNYGVSEKNPYEIVEKSLGQSMGIIIARTIKLDNASYIETILGRLFQISLKTDLSIRDRILIRNFLANAVNSKKVLEYSVPKTVFDNEIDPDGKEFLLFNQAVNLWTKNKFVIESILDENADISINNISGVSGVGNILANQLESTGMHVTEVKADQNEHIDGHGCLFSNQNKFEMTDAVLEDQLRCKKIPKPSFAENAERINIWIK